MRKLVLVLSRWTVNVFVFLVNFDHNLLVLEVILGCLEWIFGISLGGDGMISQRETIDFVVILILTNALVILLNRSHLLFRWILVRLFQTSSVHLCPVETAIIFGVSVWVELDLAMLQYLSGCSVVTPALTS